MIMKTKALISLIFVFVMLFSADIFAQRGGRSPGQRPQQRFAERPAERAERPQRLMAEDCVFFEDLSEEQQAQMKKLRLEALERSTAHRNQMGELRARKRTMMTEAEADTDAINGIIDEMTALRNVQMKERVAHRQAIRGMLTDEQRVLFDSRGQRRPGDRSPQGRQGNAPRMRCW